MSIVFLDGCESYAATGDLAKKWFNIGAGASYSAAGGKGGVPAIVITTASGIESFSSLMSATTYACGFWFKGSTTPSSTSRLFAGITAAQTYTSCLGVQTNGVVAVLNNSGSIVQGGITNICDGLFHWIEYFDNTQNSGIRKIYVDNTLNFSGACATVFGTLIATKFGFVGPTGITSTIHGIVVYDDVAGGITTASLPLGPRQITTRRMASDGTVQFVPSSGSSNYLMINETVPDGDTSYVQSGTIGQQDLYNMTALGFTPTGINGVMLNSYVENPNTGSINFRGICKSVATQTDGASVIAPSNYRTYQQGFPVDPNTAAAWTAAGLNAAQFGVKIP